MHPQVLKLPFELLRHLIRLLFYGLLLGYSVSIGTRVKRKLAVCRPCKVFIGSNTGVNHSFAYHTCAAVNGGKASSRESNYPAVNSNIGININTGVVKPVVINDGYSVNTGTIIARSFTSNGILINVPTGTV